MNKYLDGTKALFDRAKEKVVKTLTFKPPPKKSFITVRREVKPTEPLDFTFPTSMSLVQALVEVSLVATYSQGRRAIYQGAVYVNEDHVLNTTHALHSGKHTIKYGSRKEVIVMIEETDLDEAYTEPTSEETTDAEDDNSSKEA